MRLPDARRLPIFAMAAFLLVPALPAQAAPASPEGTWLSQGGQTVVRFSPCGSGWCGHMARILKTDPKQSQLDVKNPDPKLRARPLVGIRLLSLPSAEGDRWRGTVYDPRSGKTYKANVRRAGKGTLEVQGCLAMFCQTQKWTAQ